MIIAISPLIPNGQVLYVLIPSDNSLFNIFLQPNIVRPTLCWKLDWEDLESNQQHFHALCSVLRERVKILEHCFKVESATNQYISS